MLWSFSLLIYDMYITYFHKSSKKDYQKKKKSIVAWNGKTEKKINNKRRKQFCEREK